MSNLRADISLSEASPAPLQLARLYRQSDALQLKDTTKVALLRLILNALLIPEAPPVYATPTVIDVESEGDPLQICRIKIRQLVEAGARWEEIAPSAWMLFAHDHDPRTGAHILELAYLHGSLDETLAAFQKLERSDAEFYWHVHASVRNILAIRLWTSRGRSSLQRIVYTTQEAHELLPVEVLIHFLTGRQENLLVSESARYFLAHRNAIVEAVHQYGADLGITPGSVFLRAARVLNEAGMTADANKTLSLIHADQAEFQVAAKLARTIAKSQPSRQIDEYELQIKKADHWQDKLRIMERFLKALESHDTLHSFNVAGLNDLCKKPLQYFPNMPTVWRSVAKLLINYRGLRHLLPSILNLFRDQAMQFHNPNNDTAIWQEWLVAADPKDPLDCYFSGVAALHVFAISGPTKVDLLWQAKRNIESCEALFRSEGLPSWDSLREVTVSHVARDRLREESLRKAMLVQLDAALPHALLNWKTLKELIEQPFDIPARELESLRAHAKRQHHGEMQLALLHRLTSQSHWTNAQIDELWRLAAFQKNFDLAWRAATILASRQSLFLGARHAWEISGENRSDYPLHIPDSAAIQACFAHFNDKEKKLLNANLLAGPWIPELLQLLDGKNASFFTLARHKPTRADSGALDTWIQQIPFLAGTQFLPILEAPAPIQPVTVPPFVLIVQDTQWSQILLRLAQRLGMNCWGWELSKLSKVLDRLVAQCADTNKSAPTAKIQKWLRKLRPEQRLAWSELVNCNRIFGDAEVESLLSRFLIRLTTTIYGNHLEALDALRQMRAPVDLIWDFESWLTSDAYSRLRETRNQQSRFQVPMGLLSLETIVSRSET